MKAMILAAGEGRRMRPLTDDCPKPLLHVNGASLLEHQLMRLQKAGVREVVINVSYLADKILASFPDRVFGSLRLIFSVESQPLETAGGILNASDLLGDEPFLLVNGDVWTDYDYSRLIHTRLDESQLAYLVLVPNPTHNIKGDFKLRDGFVSSEGDGERYTFAGVSIIRPSLVTEFVDKRERFPLSEPLKVAMCDGRVRGELYQGDWRDIGTVERLEALRSARV
jgi:MurNAc alpha-1-phosphate uridylyltransferase